MRKFDSPAPILKEFYELRHLYYIKRKAYLEGRLQAEADQLSNQARFICEKCEGKIVIENKKKKSMIDDLVKAGYDSDPVKAWKLRVDKESALVSNLFFFPTIFFFPD